MFLRDPMKLWEVFALCLLASKRKLSLESQNRGLISLQNAFARFKVGNFTSQDFLALLCAVLRGFVVSANLRNTCWLFYRGKRQSPKSFHKKMCRKMSNSWLKKLPISSGGIPGSTGNFPEIQIPGSFVCALTVHARWEICKRSWWKQHLRFDKRGCNTSCSPVFSVNNSQHCIYTWKVAAHKYVYIYIYTHIHTYIYIYIYTHI